MPPQLAHVIRSDSVATELAEEIHQRLGKTIAELEREDWAFRRRFISRIIEGRRARVQQLVHYLTCPTFKETELVRFPRWLAPAYVPLRLARLACLAARRPIRPLLRSG